MKTKTTMKSLIGAGLAVAILSTLSSTAGAQTIINWGTATQIGEFGANPTENDAEIITTGTLFEAYSLSNTSSVTVNGVTFAAGNPFGNGFSILNAGSSYGSNVVGSAFQLDLSSSYQALMSAGNYGGNASANISGLTPGDTYEIELWSNDSRNSNPQQGAVAYGTPISYNNSLGMYTTPNPVVALTTNTDVVNNNAINGGLGEFVVGTFTADSTGAFQIGSVTKNGTLNAFEIRDVTGVAAVPEPSTWALMGLGMLGFVFMARRRSLSQV